MTLYTGECHKLFLRISKWLVCMRDKRYQSYLSFCFACEISDASLQRLCSIMQPWGSLFQMLQFPRCIQDLYIVSLLFQAVSADCFLFEHKSHLLTLNCCVCLLLPTTVAFIKVTTSARSSGIRISDECAQVKHIRAFKFVLFKTKRSRSIDLAVRPSCRPPLRDR